MSCSNSELSIASVSEEVEQPEFSYADGGSENWYTHLGKLAVANKVNHVFALQPSKSSPEMQIYIHLKTCTRRITTVLFRLQKWKTVYYIDILWYIHIVKYYR